MKTAAVALTLGLSPFEYLDLELEDLTLARVILEHTQQLRADEHEALIKALSRAIANEVLPGFNRIMNAHLKGLVRALGRG